MNPSPRPRRSPVGGYARGDETRQRIIDAAVKLFGEHGFAGASTRDIAAAAGVNAPALQYYFENKEGVYRACAEFITEDMRARLASVMRQAEVVVKSRGDVDAHINAFVAMQDVMLGLVLLQPEATGQRLFIARELAGDEPRMASLLLEQRVKEPLNKLRMALLTRIMGVGPRDPVARIRLLTLKGQVMPFFHPPGACLDALGWKEIDAAKGALIKSVVLAQVRVLLESWRVAPAGHPKTGLQLAL